MMNLHQPCVRNCVLSFFLVILAACSGGSSVSTVVTADFSAYGVKGTIDGQNITLDLTGLGNCSTTVESMVIGVNANGASISPDPRIARDYSKQVQFTLTAPDSTKVVYNVTVKGAPCVTTKPVEPCIAAPIVSTGYSLVFKGCSDTNIAEYYDKTECVRDNATGLIWQGRKPSVTSLTVGKTNYDSTTALQKNSDTTNNVPIYLAPTQAEVDAITNSIGVKNAVNASNLCGSGAWRLPTKDELLGIVKTTEYPAIDNTWFPNTGDGSYWTSSPATGEAYAAQTVRFYGGSAALEFRGGNGSFGFGIFVRLVH